MQIDGVYLSHTLQVEKSGYLPLLSSVGDHCPIWVDIRLSSVVGEPQQGHLPRNARRLRIDDTRCKQKYVQLLTKQIKEERLMYLRKTNSMQDASTLLESVNIRSIDYFNRPSKQCYKLNGTAENLRLEKMIGLRHTLKHVQRFVLWNYA